MEWLNYISMLAEEGSEGSDDGFPPLIIISIVIAVVWGVFGAIYKKIKDAAAVRQEAHMVTPSRDDYDDEDYDDYEEPEEKWQPVVAAVPPPIPGSHVMPPEHMMLHTLDESEKEYTHDKSIGDLIKPRKEEIHMPDMPSEVTVRAKARRIGRLRSTATTAEQQEEKAAPLVAFQNTSDLKRAMIFHEIFSSPKSLRHEREMWDE
ncbi:MAG: hypothetical protein K8S55_02340 [Phycisphaerae bacterium]|nr:hypothetical protein [Phycisphaerae bacterium]